MIQSLCVIFLLTISLSFVETTTKYQRFFVNTRVINFVDATKHGFRIVILDSFLDAYMMPTQIPTLFITAVPLRNDEKAITKVFYPDNIREDKQVNIADLRERSWYYICVEWENFNRHNESTGTDCRALRTLDRFGKGADSTVSDVEITDIGADAMQFRIRSLADFPIRLTASLQGGTEAIPASQTYTFHEASDIDVYFPFLKRDAEYGKLCILEEPLVSGYTSMGRLIPNIATEKCYFGKLRTKDYLLSSLNLEASAFRREISGAFPQNANVGLISVVLSIITLLKR
ncbi:hypothetical protein AB6A40_002245 [Gnathostoma spinigerum]|uniref:Uncharacterized protein n=1 Tax=Gnathostoma spinigerum TaxID=75299 RepID=A0ABD6EDS4_9BILA